MTHYRALERQGIPYRWRETTDLGSLLKRAREVAHALERATQDPETRSRLIRAAWLDTIVSSAQLEGNPLDHADASAILRGLPIPPPFEAQEEHRLDVLNHQKALAYLDRQLRNKRRAGVMDLCAIQKRIMTGLLPPGSLGRVRTLPIATYFIETGEKIGDCPDPDELGELMAELADWLEDFTRVDPILRAIGFQFLAREVHPFVAGNRRSARLMQRLLLLESGARAMGELSSWETTVAESEARRVQLPAAVAEARALNTLAPFLRFVVEAACVAMEKSLEAAVAPAVSRLVSAKERQAQASRDAVASRSPLEDLPRPTILSEGNPPEASESSGGELAGPETASRQKELD